MSDLLAAGLGVLVCGLSGLGIPRLVAAIPEPAAEPVPEHVPGSVAAAPGPDDDPKEPYADIARLPGLARWFVVGSALVGGLFGWATGADWPLLWLWPLAPVLVALAVVDLRTRLLPKVVVLPATLATLLVMAAVGFLTDQQDHLLRAVLAMVVVRSFVWVLWFVHPRGMGFGDVRLAALLGLVLGWVGWGATAVGIMLPFLLQGFGPLVVALVRRDASVLKRSIPFGPHLVAGTVFAVVWGTAIADAIWG
jgi:leader peptidase (prepilin peptidase)/N-methyltransferase